MGDGLANHCRDALCADVRRGFVDSQRCCGAREGTRLCYWRGLRFFIVGARVGLAIFGKLRMSWTRCTFCSRDFAVWMKFRIVGEVSSLRQVVWTSITAWGSRNGRIARRSAKDGWVGFLPTARTTPLPEAVIMAPASS